MEVPRHDQKLATLPGQTKCCFVMKKLNSASPLGLLNPFDAPTLLEFEEDKGEELGHVSLPLDMFGDARSTSVNGGRDPDWQSDRTRCDVPWERGKRDLTWDDAWHRPK